MRLRGGYNVDPREIEEVLYEHPAVAEAAVVGVPHEELGEVVGAAVTLKPGCDVSAELLRTYVKENVAAYRGHAFAHKPQKPAENSGFAGLFLRESRSALVA